MPNYRTPIPPFSGAVLEGVARTLADTTQGLSGSEISRLLADCKVPDVEPAITKWKRLYAALAAFQNINKVGNHVVMFICRAMEPARYTGNIESFRWRQSELNMVLPFNGLRLRDDGKVERAGKADTLDDAQRLAGRMHAELARRGAHEQVLRFCEAEVLAQNVFHAVLEAMKSITSRLRTLSGLTTDGAALVESCFNVKNPLLQINALNTESDKGEQRGFANLLVGLYGTFRNPTAHEPKIEWALTEQDALDVLTTLSLIHRRLDRTKPISGP